MMLGSAADKLVLPNDAGFSSGYITKNDAATNNLLTDNDAGFSS